MVCLIDGEWQLVVGKPDLGRDTKGEMNELE